MEKELIIATCPHIIKKVFFHLGPKDLSVCAKVCKFWNKIAENEKQRRKDICWLFKVGLCEDHNLSCFTYKICNVATSQEMEDSFVEEMENIRMQPAFCMMFMSSSLFHNFEHFFPYFCRSSMQQPKKLKLTAEVSKRKYLNAIVDITLKPYLPAKCPVAFAVAPGVVGCKRLDYTPVEIEDGPALTAMLLPSLPGVQFHCFPIIGRNPNLSTFISEKAPVKCLLVFLTPRGTSSVNKLLQSCLKAGEDSLNMAVGGSIVQRTESLLGSVIAFSGENVDAASVIINPGDRQSALEAKLKLLGDTGLLKHKCFAYMFACVGRGFCIYNEYNIESSTFCKMYPGVPLIGIFGNGEIGVNHYPNISLNNNLLETGMFVERKKKFLYGYTTVFVLISIKM